MNEYKIKKPADGVTVKITFTDGSLWELPAQVIIDKKLSFRFENGQKEKMTEEEIEDIIIEETEYLLSDEFELRDMMHNNMDWADIKPHATMIRPPKPVEYFYDREFANTLSEVCGLEKAR